MVDTGPPHAADEGDTHSIPEIDMNGEMKTRRQSGRQRRQRFQPVEVRRPASQLTLDELGRPIQLSIDEWLAHVGMNPAPKIAT